MNLDWAGSSNFLPGDTVTLSLFFFKHPLAFPAGERREASKDRCKFGFQGSRENKWESYCHFLLLVTHPQVAKSLGTCHGGILTRIMVRAREKITPSGSGDEA